MCTKEWNIKSMGLRRKFSIVLSSLIEVITIITYSLFIVYHLTATSKIGAIWPSYIDNKRLVNVFFVISLLKIFTMVRNKYADKWLAFFMLTIVLLLKKYGIADYTQLVFIMIAMYSIAFEKVAMMYVATMSVSLATILWLSIIGIIPNGSVIAEHRVIKNLYFLGFSHHNRFMICWLLLLMVTIYLTRNCKYKKYIFLLLEGITVYLWTCTGSNTSTIIASILCLIFILDDFIYHNYKYNEIKQCCAKLLIWTPAISFAISVLSIVFVGCFGYPDLLLSLFDRFDKPYTALIKLGVIHSIKHHDIQSMYSDLGFNWIIGLGKNTYPGKEFFDNIYAYIFINDGLIVLVSFIAIQTLILYRLFKEREYCLLLLYAFKVFFGVFEAGTILDVELTVFATLLFTIHGSYLNYSGRQKAISQI